MTRHAARLWELLANVRVLEPDFKRNQPKEHCSSEGTASPSGVAGFPQEARSQRLLGKSAQRGQVEFLPDFGLDAEQERS